jgi:hypothetical protein
MGTMNHQSKTATRNITHNAWRNDGEQRKTCQAKETGACRHTIAKLLLLGGVGQGEICGPRNANRRYKRLNGGQLELKRKKIERTYDLELNWDHPEIQDLYCRPEYIVGLQRRHVYILELAGQRPPAAALSHGHEGEEAHQSCTQLISSCLSAHGPRYHTKRS